VAAAVLLVLLTGGGTVWYFAPGPDEVSRVLQIGLEAHRQCSQEPGLDYLGWEYSGLVDVVGAEMPSNYGIAAAHQCVLKGRTFVHLVFESGNTRASFVVTEKENERFTASDKNRPFDADGVPVYFNTIDKHEVAGFETRRHLAFVVSDLDRDANLQLSRSIAVLYAPSVRSTLQEVSNAH
jgi:hypothetical protein